MSESPFQVPDRHGALSSKMHHFFLYRKFDNVSISRRERSNSNPRGTVIGFRHPTSQEEGNGEGKRPIVLEDDDSDQSLSDDGMAGFSMESEIGGDDEVFIAVNTKQGSVSFGDNHYVTISQ